MLSDLWAAVAEGSSALQSLATSLPDVALASRAPSAEVLDHNYAVCFS